MNKRKLVTGVISIIILLIAVITMLEYRNSLDDVAKYLQEINPWILLLLIPNVILMYYAAGRIWYPYLKANDLSTTELAKIHYEINFVNTVVPVAAISGLVYSTERLRAYGVKSGQTSWLYVYRYIVSIATNWIGIIAAAAILLITGKMHDMPILPLIITAVMIFAVLLVVLALIFVIASRAHSNKPTRYRLVQKFWQTKLGQRFDQFTQELSNAITLAKTDKHALVSSWVWGMIYTTMEDLPFLIVAWALGHPELFLQMVVAAGAGIIVGILTPTPGGIGGFDGAMIFLLGGFGTNVALSSAIVLTTRIVVLTFTTVTSYPFWQRGMIKISRLQKETAP